MIRVLKKIIHMLKSIFAAICRAMFFYWPFFILLILVAYYFNHLNVKELSDTQYRMLFSLIGLSAVISGLSLRAAALHSEAQKEAFKTSGELLLYSCVAFIMALAMRFADINAQVISFSSIKFMATAIKFIANISGGLFFFYGVVATGRALGSLNTVLWDIHFKNY